MSFGGYNYGPDDSDDGEGQQQGGPVQVRRGELIDDPDHPLSDEQCDHRNCKNETPDKQQRICEDCTILMRAETPDRCNYCGESL